MPEQTRALTIAQPHADLPTESEWNLIQRMSQAFEASNLYRNINGVAQFIAVVQTGRELGVPPAAALRSFNFIGGKPTASAEMLAALIYRDHGDSALRVVETTNERCTVEYRRRGWDSPGRLTFTLADAQAAGLTKGDKHNANWDKYPRAMLRSRAISEAARTAFQDSILGMYTSEELAPERVIVTEEGELLLDRAPDEPAEGVVEEAPRPQKTSVPAATRGRPRTAPHPPEEAPVQEGEQTAQDPAIAALRTEALERFSRFPEAWAVFEKAAAGKTVTVEAWQKAVERLRKMDAPTPENIERWIEQGASYIERFTIDPPDRTESVAEGRELIERGRTLKPGVVTVPAASITSALLVTNVEKLYEALLPSAPQAPAPHRQGDLVGTAAPGATDETIPF